MVLGMGITEGKLQFCHVFPKQIRDKNISIIDYDNMTIYDWYKSNFPFYCGILSLNLFPRRIDYILHQNKIACYTPDTLPAAIYVSSKNILVLLPPLATSHKLFS